jgi:hypothetical protein
MDIGKTIGVIAVAAIALGLIMAVTDNPKMQSGINYLTNGSNRQSQIPASGPSIVGGPSLSASKIDTILSSAGSPAAGSGQEFVLGSATYDIDDAYALAWFHHESSYGTSGAAVQTHSIGNIICTAGYKCIGRFRAYSSWSEGIDDWYQLISGPYYVGQGLTTLDRIIPKYAPAGDGNDPQKYIAAVEGDVQTWRAA